LGLRASGLPSSLTLDTKMSPKSGSNEHVVEEFDLLLPTHFGRSRARGARCGTICVSEDISRAFGRLAVAIVGRRGGRPFGNRDCLAARFKIPHGDALHLLVASSARYRHHGRGHAPPCCRAAGDCGVSSLPRELVGGKAEHTKLASTALPLVSQQLVPNSRIRVRPYVVPIGTVNAIRTAVDGSRPDGSEGAISTHVRLAVHLALSERTVGTRARVGLKPALSECWCNQRCRECQCSYYCSRRHHLSLCQRGICRSLTDDLVSSYIRLRTGDGSAPHIAEQLLLRDQRPII